MPFLSFKRLIIKENKGLKTYPSSVDLFKLWNFSRQILMLVPDWACFGLGQLIHEPFLVKHIA
jgi:hypothetical protein